MSITDLTMLAFFSALMSFAAASDLVTMTIPNRVSLALVAGFLVFALVVGLPPLTIAWHLAAGLVVLCVAFGMFGFGWIGGGDAKLAAATGVWCGFPMLAEYSLLSAVFGGFLTLGLLAGRTVMLPIFAQRWAWLVRLHDKSTGIPYGIALAAAGLMIFPETAIWKTAFSV